MPLFEYRCKKCEHLEEVLQKHGEPPPEECPECGAKGSMDKEISLTSFQLKGGGWYNDLYSSVPKDKSGGGSGDGGKKDKADKANKKESKSSKKSDTKAA